MHNNKDPDYIDTNETNLIIHGNTINQPQLTPTGKISHAKTRVYTQRYRKAWEQMPDFKGWLTSVPQQPTRAFCTYCRKNLHAHRLSLLKHTCTMKHQRGALMHQKESNANKNAVSNTAEKILPINDDDHIQMQDELHHEELVEEEVGAQFKVEDDADDDDDDDIEYVVERLDDDDMEDDEQSKDIDDDDDDDADNDYAEDEDEVNLPITKKMKTGKDENTNRHDTLAEAMAHVHGEYLDENGESVNVELEMVVESVDQNDQEMRIVSVRTEREEEEQEDDDDDEDEHQGEDEQQQQQHQITIENYDDDENSTDYVLQDNEKEVDLDNENENQPIDQTATTISSCKSSVLGEFSSDGNSEIDDTDHLGRRNSSSTKTGRRNYLSRHSTARTIPSLPGTSGGSSNGTAIPKSKKTITLSSSGTTVTIDTSSITPYSGGSRYLVNTFGQESNIVLSHAGKENQGVRNEGQIKIAQHQQIACTATPATTYSTPGTSSSQTKPRKHIILKSVKPLIAKKPCISTHVLDTSKGLPVGGLQISLYKLMDGRWTFLNESNTTAEGRCADLVDTSKYTFTAGRYKLHFDVDKYFTLRRIETMYPFIEIIFDVKNPTEHYHIPVLISPFGYTTYRGS